MITAALVFMIVLIAAGAMVVYKFVGKKGRVAEREADATSSGASVGRATGRGQD